MGRLKYLDFELKFERQGGGFVARILHSPSGEASGTFTLPFSEDKLENLVLRLGNVRRGTRRVHSPEMEAAREFGGKLFEAVFSADLRACFKSSLDETSREPETGLRLKLRLQDTPELADLPWEFLFDPSFDRFLAQSDYTPVVRYIELPERITPLTVTLPLRLLVMISSPADYVRLDVEREKSNMTKALEPLVNQGKVQMEWLEEATLRVLQQRLREREYHIFHFIGHGGFDTRSDYRVLVLKDERGNGWLAGGHRVAMVLHDRRSLRLAVLNSCEGARNSRLDPFAGVAATLVRQGLPAVVAMQFEISDEAAITFSGELYAALSDGFPVDAALAEARKAIYLQPNDVEWGTPVLYMRSPDGVLFNLAEAPVADKEKTIRPPTDTTGPVEPKPVPPPSLQPEPKTTAVPLRPRRRVMALGAGVAALVALVIVGWFSFGPQIQQLWMPAPAPAPAVPPATTVAPQTKDQAVPPAAPEAPKEETPAASATPQPKKIAQPKKDEPSKTPQAPKSVTVKESAEECFARAQEYSRHKNSEQAAPWYRKAADQGHIEAAYSLGTLYLSGRGVTRDDKAGFTWVLKAAEKGFAPAQSAVGYCYEGGRGITQNYYEAAQWYRKAADQGDRSGQWNLGKLYMKGLGVPRDPAEAVALYKKSAVQQNVAAQFELGRIYEKGAPGVARDTADAMKWYRMAAQQGYKPAQDALARLEGSAGVSKEADTTKKTARPKILQKKTYQTLAKGKLYYYDFDTPAQLTDRPPGVDFFFKADSPAPDSAIGVYPSNNAKFAPTAKLLPWDVPADRFITTSQSVPQGRTISCVTSEGRHCTFSVRKDENGQLMVSFMLYDSR